MPALGKRSNLDFLFVFKIIYSAFANSYYLPSSIIFLLFLKTTNFGFALAGLQFATAKMSRFDLRGHGSTSIWMCYKCFKKNSGRSENFTDT